MYIHDHACIYIYTTMYVYNYVLCIYIYAPIYIYIFTQPNLMREDDCTDMFVDNFLFMAEQLRNVSAMDAVRALHHISTMGLLALGYIVMCIYIYTYAVTGRAPIQTPRIKPSGSICHHGACWTDGLCLFT